ncbi:beta-ketothiolase BktB [Sphingobium sp.]|uniref:beta-ketothiolase BktB n=1 Tax=Sphingobium sp. TaxID=1912891 RepID=UPI003BB6488F
MESIYILAGTRTAIGTFGGSLKDVSPTELGTIVIREALARAGVAGADVGHVVMGNVIPTVPMDAYLARVAAVEAGIPVDVPALTLNRLCGSGLQAIISGAQMVALGETDIVVAGGAETMSRAPHMAVTARFGQRMGDITMVDTLTGSLSDPFSGDHMGVTAENVASDFAICRETQDALAHESHRRATAARSAGRFKDQIVALQIQDRKGVRAFDQDEHIREDVSIDDLANLRPVFRKYGSVTAGNASGVNDGAAAVVLASQKSVDAFGLRPKAKILSWGHAGVEPSRMGLGPIKAVPIALERAGLTVDDMDTIESNEAFAAQACAVAQTLHFPSDKLNPNGSGISLGHPIGATGCILVVKALYELERIAGRYGLITMCIGGGQGIAMVIERASQP